MVNSYFGYEMILRFVDKFDDDDFESDISYSTLRIHFYRLLIIDNVVFINHVFQTRVGNILKQYLIYLKYNRYLFST